MAAARTAAPANHQHLHELAAGQRVKVGDWLVEQQEFGALAQRERERGLRLLPAREAADALVERNAQAGEVRTGPRLVEARIQPAAHAQRVGHRETRVQRLVLGDERDLAPRARRARRRPENTYLAPGRRQQSDS
jgi:hypothetical protein